MARRRFRSRRSRLNGTISEHHTGAQAEYKKILSFAKAAKSAAKKHDCEYALQATERFNQHVGAFFAHYDNSMQDAALKRMREKVMDLTADEASPGEALHRGCMTRR